MACKYCKKRGKIWIGSEPRCAFDSGVFSNDNWNCATMNYIRDTVSDYYCVEDQKYAMIPLFEGVLVLSWYKDRGVTDTASIIDVDGDIEPITVERAEQLVDDYFNG